MKAAYITQTGPPEVIQYGELPDPKPAPTQVLVKVGAVSVNPIDTYIRSGAVALPRKYPYIIGSDLAGTVVSCGAEVRLFKPGDRVWEEPGDRRPPRFVCRAGRRRRTLAYPTPAKQSDAEAAAGALVGSRPIWASSCTRCSSRVKSCSLTEEPVASDRPSCSLPNGPVHA